MTKPPINRVQVQSYRVSNKPVTVDTTATNGAQFGVNVWDPSGNLVAWPLASSSTSSSFTGTTDDVNEGQWNLYFTIPRAQDAVGAILQNSANVTLTYVTHASIKADLTTITPTSGGTLQATAFDSYGRINKTQAITWATAGTVAMAYTSSTNTVSASLNTTSVTAGSYGSATQSPTFTVNATGQLTAAANVTITPAWSSITGTPTTLAGYGITDAVKNTRQVIAGTGLSGGGALSSDVTLSLANIPSQTLMGNYSSVTGAPSTITIGANLTLSSSGVLSATGGGSGGVTSVGLAAPTQFNVTGSPVTGSGTLTFAWATQSAALVLAGPATGSAAAPTFRSLALTDLPAIATATLLGNPATATATPTTITIGSGLTLSTAGVLSTSGTTGTVTSVGLSAPSQFSVSGSPVTTTGTLTFSWSNQTANAVLCGPSSGSAAAPTFRSLVNADIPTSLSITSLTTSSTITFGTSISSSTTNAVFSTTGAGTVYLRPNGAGSTQDQTTLSNIGLMTVNATGSNGTTLTLVDSSDIAGIKIMAGNGSTNPNKFIRVNGNTGNLEFANSAYNSIIMTLSDVGALSAQVGTFTTSGATLTLNIVDAGANGANLKLSGNGSTNPNKYFRAQGGLLQYVNSAYSSVITSMDDSGNWIFSGSLSATSATFTGQINANTSGVISTNVGTLQLQTTLTSGAQIKLLPQTNSGNGLSVTTSGVNPLTDNTLNLGTSGNRYTAVWAVNGTIQTSDAREKTPMTHLNDAELRVAKHLLGKIGIFQWLSDIESKVSKHHVGTIAQDICSAFESEGLDWRLYGMITHEDDRFGVNYAQLNQFLAASIHHRLTALESALLIR